MLFNDFSIYFHPSAVGATGCEVLLLFFSAVKTCAVSEGKDVWIDVVPELHA